MNAPLQYTCTAMFQAVQMKIVRRKIVIIVNIVLVKAQVLGTRLNHIIKLDTAPVVDLYLKDQCFRNKMTT